MLKVGSSGPQVRAWQEVMLARFAAYALESNGEPLRPDSYFGYSDRDVQREYERRTGQFVDGVVGDHDLAALGIAPPPSKPVLFTVCGTGVPWWVGPDADLARAVEHKYRWQPVGYRAAPFPMATSVKEGRTELIRLINLPENQGDINFAGYSQGATIVSELWEYDIKPQSGRLHNRVNDVKRVACFGNPMREQGNAYQDPGGPVVNRESCGIADRLMVDTPKWWRNYAHRGDIYTDVTGQAGEWMTSIYKVVMGTRIFTGPDSLVSQLLIELPERPVVEVVAMFHAIIEAGMFFANGTGPHTNYSIEPAKDYLLNN
ncbi:MAG: peptidoglycan-binding domain-containing protein [Mycobacterium sp.]